MQRTDRFLKGKDISRRIEAFQCSVHSCFDKKLKVKLETLLQNTCNLIMARPFCKISGFKCTPDCDFVSSYLRCLAGDFKMQGMCI